jgi:CubicO group peptidase (beta-lactamase class C family)
MIVAKRFLLICFGLIVGTVLLPRERVSGQAGTENPVRSADALRALLEQARTKLDVPALAVSVVAPGEPALVAAVGVRKRGTDVAATADDRWHLGSNSKPITALLVALLIDLGLLDWDTPLEQVFPEEAANWGADLKKVTPAHLLTHTAGLPKVGPLRDFLRHREPGTPAGDRAKVLKRLAEVKLASKPGEKFEYSNLGYVVLAAIIDRRGKAPWEEQVRKKIFAPLGIKSAGFGPVSKKDDGTQPWPHRANGKPEPADGVLDNPRAMNSSGRVHMTVADYDRFLAETLRLARGEHGLLKPATAQKFFTNPYPISSHSLSGWIGFRKEPGAKGLVLGHDGSNLMNYCTAVVLPDRNRALCVFTNQGAPDGPGEKVCHDVTKKLRAGFKATAQAQLPPGVVGRLGSVRFWTGSCVNAVAFSPPTRRTSSGVLVLLRSWVRFTIANRAGKDTGASFLVFTRGFRLSLGAWRKAIHSLLGDNKGRSPLTGIVRASAGEAVAAPPLRGTGRIPGVGFFGRCGARQHTRPRPKKEQSPRTALLCLRPFGRLPSQALKVFNALKR